MKDKLKSLTKTKPEKRLDELFSRKTLGAVLFGAAVSKVVEKTNALITLGLIGVVDPGSVNMGDVWSAIILCTIWLLELFLFTYVYVRWEKAIKSVAENVQ